VQNPDPGIRRAHGPQQGDEPRIDLHGFDAGAGAGQRHRERADPGTDLQDRIVGLRRGGLQDTVQDAAIDEKVLAARRPEPQAGDVEGRPDAGAGCEIDAGEGGRIREGG
jgi:hypothetical protein